MKLPRFKHYSGQHCETTTAGCLLRHAGIELTEPMIFGLGEGLGYIYWYSKAMDFPFIGGRVKPDVLTTNLCRNLNLDLKVSQTSSAAKAWDNVASSIEAGNPVGLKLDCFHLDYFSTKIHFAGHYVTLYGFDNEFAYLVDTRQQGGKVKVSLENLALARNEKGPMSSKNLSFTITGNAIDPGRVVTKAIRNNALDYLHPPIKNIAYKGILKTAGEIKKWYTGNADQRQHIQTIAMLMERGGTGGALFRNLYRDFLQQAGDLVSLPVLKQSAAGFDHIASLWTDVARHLNDAGESSGLQPVNAAADLLVTISKEEEKAMNRLLNSLPD